MSSLLGKHEFRFDNNIIFETEFHDNGDDEGNFLWTVQKFILRADGNEATISLGSTRITPDELRKLANEIDKQTNKFSVRKK